MCMHMCDYISTPPPPAENVGSVYLFIYYFFLNDNLIDNNWGRGDSNPGFPYIGEQAMLLNCKTLGKNVALSCPLYVTIL